MKYFDFNSTDVFETFSVPHFVVLFVILCAWIAAVMVMKKAESEKAHRYFRVLLGILLIVSELSNTLWRALTGHFAVGESLPLHLCGISSFTGAAMLFSGNMFLVEFNYFVGIGGAIQALATPDTIHNFPHFDFFQHFITHMGIVLAVLYMVLVKGLVPRWSSSLKVFLVTNVYMAVIYFFNLAVGGNYLFLNQPPASPSLIDTLIEIFGPHPWYIIGLEVIGVITFALLLVPIVIRNVVRKRRGGI